MSGHSKAPHTLDDIRYYAGQLARQYIREVELCGYQERRPYWYTRALEVYIGDLNAYTRADFDEIRKLQTGLLMLVSGTGEAKP